MKTKNNFFCSLFFISTLMILTSCTSITGVGPVITESRNLTEINAVDLEMAADVYLIKGDTQGLVISAQKNILDLIRTDVSSGKLEIKSAESISVTQPVQIWITLKTIEDVELSGSGSITSDTPFNAEKISADLSGSGKISLVLNCKKFSGDLSGSGDIYLKGKISTGDFDLSGSGNIYSQECEIDKCKIAVNGSGTAKIMVQNELDSEVNGSGTILYSGSPQKVKSNINGSGSISKMN